jgi:hypothetical protein
VTRGCGQSATSLLKLEEFLLHLLGDILEFNGNSLLQPMLHAGLRTMGKVGYKNKTRFLRWVADRKDLPVQAADQSSPR